VEEEVMVVVVVGTTLAPQRGACLLVRWMVAAQALNASSLPTEI
jgi:hypothetical protein